MVSRHRQRHVGRNLAFLLILLLVLLSLFFELREKETGQVTGWKAVAGFFKKNPAPLYGAGQQVRVENGNQVGKIIDYSVALINGDKEIIYTVQFSSDSQEEVNENSVQVLDSPFRLGETVALVNSDYWGELEDGQIEEVQVSDTDSGLAYTYSANFPNAGRLENLNQEDFIRISSLALSEENTGLQNQQILQEAIDRSKDYTRTRLLFPSGKFLIGSSDATQSHVILTSNLELIGQDTTLVVEGYSYWLGLTTGPNATDGLSNFVMDSLSFVANDLKKGAEFKLMANHGYNWEIKNNRFTLVHALSSHVFDLGGVQYAVFDGNVFEGYAPELATVTEIGDRELHNFYSEAIQLDMSSNNGIWDGGLIQALDPNYDNHNPSSFVSDYITIVNNEFLPYYNKKNKLIAYGASIGQHGSDVGTVTIYGNYFRETLSARFINEVDAGSQYLMEPIHFVDSSFDYQFSNTIE